MKKVRKESKHYLSLKTYLNYTSSICGHMLSLTGGVCSGPFNSLHSIKNCAMPW